MTLWPVTVVSSSNLTQSSAHCGLRPSRARGFNGIKTYSFILQKIVVILQCQIWRHRVNASQIIQEYKFLTNLITLWNFKKVNLLTNKYTFLYAIIFVAYSNLWIIMFLTECVCVVILIEVLKMFSLLYVCMYECI